MKLRTKLILSFAIVVLLVGGIGLTSSLINESVKDRVTTESEKAIEEIELAGELSLQLYQSITRTQYLLEDQYRQSLSSELKGENISTDLIIREIDNSLSNFEQSIQKTKSIIRQDSSEFTKESTGSLNLIQQIDSLEVKFNIYSSLVDQLQELSSEDYNDAKEFFTVTVEPYFRTSLLPLIESVREEIKATHQAKITELNNMLNTFSYWLGVATLLALIITISLTFFLYRSIAHPLNKIADAAQRIGHGNLNKRINYSSDDELGQLSQTFNRMAENLSRTTVSRDYVDSIIESMADLLIVTDEQLKITRINSAGLAMLNSDQEDLLGKQVGWIFKENLFSLLGNGTGDHSDIIKSKNAEIHINNGKQIPVSLSKGAIKTKDNSIQGYVIVASDISPQKEAQQKLTKSLKEKQVLLSEIHHRVKNNLAVISGLLQMQMWEADNEHAVSALQESQMRVQSIALVHEKLYQTESLSYIQYDTYIRDLLEAISSTYLLENAKIEVTTDLEEIVLNINQAIPCSLLLNEIVTNALKHAFTNQEEGTVQVTMSEVDNQIYLKVVDNGKGFPDDTAGKDSLGMSLIETLAKQLKGGIEFKDTNGTEVIISFHKEEVNTE